MKPISTVALLGLLRIPGATRWAQAVPVLELDHKPTLLTSPLPEPRGTGGMCRGSGVSPTPLRVIPSPCRTCPGVSTSLPYTGRMSRL